LRLRVPVGALVVGGLRGLSELVPGPNPSKQMFIWVRKEGPIIRAFTKY